MDFAMKIKEFLLHIEEVDKLLVIGYCRQNYHSDNNSNVTEIPMAILEFIVVFAIEFEMDSVILTPNEKRSMFTILRSEPLNDASVLNTEVEDTDTDSKCSRVPLKLNLLYRMSRDGKSGAAWHSKCDNIGPTVLLIRSQYNHVFGGYAHTPWTSTSRYYADEYAFLFLLRSKFSADDNTTTDANTNTSTDTRLFAYECPKVVKFTEAADKSQRVYHYNSKHGPAFGTRHVLIVDNDLGGNTYTIHNEAHFTGNELCGGKQFDSKAHHPFQADEWEMFEVICS